MLLWWVGAEPSEEQPSTAVIRSAFSCRAAPFGLQFTAENNLPTLFPPWLGGDYLPSVSAFSLKASLDTTHRASLLGERGVGSLADLPLSSFWVHCSVPGLPGVVWSQHHCLLRIILLLLSTPSSCCPRLGPRSFPSSFRYSSSH